MGRFHKEVQELIDYAKDYGFSVAGKVTGKGHWLLVHNSGASVTIAASPRGYRWKKNAEASLRRIDRGARGDN